MNLKIWNNSHRPLGIAGISIPPGRGVRVRNLTDADVEKVRRLVDSGDFSAPGLDQPKAKPTRKKAARKKATSKTGPVTGEGEEKAPDVGDGDSDEPQGSLSGSGLGAL